jgi:hypothetical protein
MPESLMYPPVTMAGIAGHDPGICGHDETEYALTIPVQLLGPVAACALFADRLMGRSTYAIPYRAAGALDLGAELLAIVDRVPAGAAHDRELVDAWADAMGMNGWYAWIPYKP